MLFFTAVPHGTIASVRREGLREVNGRPVALWTTPSDAAQAMPGLTVLAVDDRRLNARSHWEDGVRFVDRVPPAALVNVDPYLPLEEIQAAGGYVVRRVDEELEVLLIFRRGHWDLPKGKLDSGETPEAGALREVREEVGIQDLTVVGPLGETVHGYPHAGLYFIKTTFWFHMETPETRFSPQEEEEIEEVAWKPWEEARGLVAYPNLQVHMERVERLGLLRFRA